MGQERSEGRPLGVASLQRLKSLPDIPTLHEQDLEGFEAYAWQALVAPVAIKAETVQSLNGHLNEALRSEAIQARMAALGIEPTPSTPGELQAFAVAERERWGRVIREARIQLD